MKTAKYGALEGVASAADTVSFAKIYDNLAAFAAVAYLPAAIKEVIISGYYSGGDGGRHIRKRLAAAVAVKPWHVVLSDGSMWDISDSEYDIRMFGVRSTNTPLQNSTCIQNAIDAASINLRKLHVRGDPIDCVGGIFIRSNVTMEWHPGAWLRQTAFSATGAFMTNVSPVQAERAVRDIILINPLIDLSAITYAVENTTNSENCLAFARGAERILVSGGILKGAKPNFNCIGGWGGKAIGLDGGVKAFTMLTTRLESCLYGIWVRGNEHQFTTAADGYERTTSNKFVGCHIEDMPLPIAIMGRDADEDPDFRMEDIAVQIIATTAHNVGFCPNTPASNTDRYKAGIINLGEAQNFLIDGFTGYNDDNYLASKGGWPTTGDVIGQGLTGAVCHLICGWGGAGTIRNIHFQGSIDYMWKCERAFPIGDDAASSDPLETRRVKANFLLIDNIRHVGACTGVFSQSDYYPVNSTSDIRARMDNIFPYALSDGIVAGNAATLESMTIKVFQSVTKWIEGTPKFLYTTVGNALASTDSQSWSENHRNSKPQSYPIKTIANNDTISFPLTKMDGLIAFSCSASLAQGIIKYRASAGGTQATIYGPANIGNVAVTTGGSPAGTASTLTFSIDDAGNMWVNNQRGASLVITLNQLV